METNLDGLMTQQEIDEYEAKIKILRQNRPALREDLPKITGIFSSQICNVLLSQLRTKNDGSKS